MRHQDIAAMLESGDRRSIERSYEVKKLVSRQLKSFPELLKCLWDEDPVIRMRAAEAAERVTRAHPELLNPHKQELLGLLVEAEQIEWPWHLALMGPRWKLQRAGEGACRRSLRALPGRSQFHRENSCAPGAGRSRPAGCSVAGA